MSSPERRWFWHGWTPVQRFLVVLLAIYLAKQAVYVVAFRPFSGHDEVAHYTHLRIVATEGRLPVLPDLTTWRAAIAANVEPTIDRLPDELYPYCRYTLDWHCDPDHPIWSKTPPRAVTVLDVYYPSGYLYSANHPPLYYFIMTPLYWLSAGFSPVIQHYLLRVAAIPFGVATVLLAYVLARTLFPGDAFLAMTVPSVVAFQPQISYEAAMVNNDIVAIALYSLIIWLVIGGLAERFSNRRCLVLGGALGLALLAKGTSVTAAGVIGLAVVLSVGWRDVAGWLRRGVLIALPTVALAAPWYVYLYRTYGNFDGFDQIAALQDYWNQPAGTFLDLLTDRGFVEMRFRETWGEFGWRLIHLDLALLWLIALPLIVALGGLVYYTITGGRNLWTVRDDPVRHPARWQWIGLAVLIVTCLISYLAVVQFGTRFVLTQARYFFPAVNAGALLAMLGLRTVVPHSLHRYAQGAVFAALVLLNVVIFTAYVIPHYLSV